MSLFDNFSYFMLDVDQSKLGDDPLEQELYNRLFRLKVAYKIIYEKKDKIKSLQKEIDTLNQEIHDLLEDCNKEVFK